MVGPNYWIVTGHTKRTLNYGEVRNAADEDRWWVWWHVSNHAERVAINDTHMVFGSKDAAIDEFETRAALLWGS